MLRFLTAGESHGKALVAILEGMPKGLSLTEDDIAKHLARRQKGYGRGNRQNIERDRAQILSGVRLGKTLGSPIALLIENLDSKNWEKIMSPTPLHPPPPPLLEPRPGHADLAGLQKYEDSDIRNILERASARETAARVAVGSIARKLLEEFHISIGSIVISIGRVSVPKEALYPRDWQKAAEHFQKLFARAERSQVRTADKKVEEAMVQEIEQAKREKDTLGGKILIAATGLPPGLGSFMHWDKKLDGLLAQALMSIPAVKGVAIGEGFSQAELPGTAVHDGIFYSKKRGFTRKTNRAGGLEAGVTNGMPLLLEIAMKPIATTMKGLPSVNVQTKKPAISLKERSDVCAVPACGVVAEAVVALVLANAFLRKFGGDTLAQIKRSVVSFQKALSML